jgi:hypothetical protein
MKHLVIAIAILSFGLSAYCQQSTNSLLSDLNDAIAKGPQYDEAKLKSINDLKIALAKKDNNTPGSKFFVYSRLYDEYKIFKYDSAYNYSKKLLEAAYQLNDQSKVNYAKIKQGFILLSSGMFKEAYDSLKRIDISHLPDTSKAEYYSLMARYYYDLADYDNDIYHTPEYNKQGNDYLDSAFNYYDTTNFEYLYFQGLKDIRSNNRPHALINFKKIMSNPHLSFHEIALTASTLSDIYIQNGQIDTATALLVQAAIADIKSSTKETAAIFNLASILFKQGDLKNASTYIERAINDAVFYGARQRKVQVSAILPLIEGEKISRVENQKKTLITYSAIATLLLIALVTLTVIVFRQVAKLKAAEKIIMAAHAKQQEINTKLLEANKIKEEYIGYFFNGNSEFFSKIERFKKSVEQKIAERKLEEIKFLVNNINLKKEKEELLKNFDKVFLKLFPNFIDEFNKLFAEEDKIKLKDNELLNTDLRIFALIRMGIHDNEKIAQILEYSVNTINTYKTKIKNKSIVPNEDFEHRIMDIKTV